jgi:hypothetical protein
MGGTATSYAYDAQGRVQRIDTTIDAKTYSRYSLYNTQGQLSYLGYPDSASNTAALGVRHEYNTLGYATRISRDTTAGSGARWRNR